MSRIVGTVYIDFETDPSITEAQFEKFKVKMNSMIESWEMMLYEASSDLGFEADELHPLILDDLEMDEE